MKQIEAFYWYYKNNSEAEFVFPADAVGGKTMLYLPLFGNDTQKNNIINILNYPITEEINLF